MGLRKQADFVHGQSLAVQVGGVLSQHLERLAESAPRHAVYAMCVSCSNHIRTSLVYGGVDEEASNPYTDI